MPYNASGAYALPGTYKGTPGTTILSTQQHNTPLEDIKDALNLALLRDGRAQMSGALTLSGNAVNPLHAVPKQQLEAYSIASKTRVDFELSNIGGSSPETAILSGGQSAGDTQRPFSIKKLGAAPVPERAFHIKSADTVWYKVADDTFMPQMARNFTSATELTDIVNRALEDGYKVKFPYVPGLQYLFGGTVTIPDGGVIYGDDARSSLIRGNSSGPLFDLLGSKVSIKNIDVNEAAATAGASLIRLNVTAANREKIRIENVHGYDGFLLLNDVGTGTKTYDEIYINELWSHRPRRGTVVNLTRAAAFFEVERIAVDFNGSTALAAALNEPVISIVSDLAIPDIGGLYFRGVDVLGTTNLFPGQLPLQDMFKAEKVRSLYIDRIDAEFVGGSMVNAKSVDILELRSCEASFVGGHGIKLDTVTRAIVETPRLVGASGTGHADGVKHGIYVAGNCDDISVSNTAFIQGFTGDRVHRDGSNVRLKIGLGPQDDTISRAPILDNGNMNIWQRGTLFNTSGAFRMTADRWLDYGGAATIAVNRVSFGTGDGPSPLTQLNFAKRITFTTGGAGGKICQRIDKWDDVTNSLMNLAAYMKATVGVEVQPYIRLYFGTGAPASATVDIIGRTVLVPSTWADISQDLLVPTVQGKDFGTNADYFIEVGWLLNAFAGATLDYTGARLTDRPYEPVYIQTENDELDACQVYYEKTFDLNVAPAQNAGTDYMFQFPQQGSGAGAPTNWPVPFKSRKRNRSYTVTFYNPSAANGKVRNIPAAADMNNTAVASNSATRNGFSVYCEAFAGPVAGALLGVHYTVDNEFALL